MAMSKDELKAAILKKSQTAAKPQLYIKDFYECDPDAKPREVKNAANELVKEGMMDFWSSGSTTMYAAKGRAKNEETREHDEEMKNA